MDNHEKPKALSAESHRAEFIRLAKKILRRIERTGEDEYWWHDVRELSHELNFIRLAIGKRHDINSNFNRPAFYVSEVWRDADGSLATTSGTELLYGLREWFDRYPWISHATTVTLSGCDPEDEVFSAFVPLDIAFDKSAYDLANPDTKLLYESVHPLPLGVVADQKAMADVRLQVIKCLQNWIDAVELAVMPSAQTGTQKQTVAKPSASAVDRKRLEFYKAQIAINPRLRVKDVAELWNKKENDVCDEGAFKQSTYRARLAVTE